MTEATQKSKEWFESRKLRITGSIIGAILGVSPWQKPRDILRAKVREYHDYPSEFEAQFVADHGVHREQRALLAFMRETGLAVEQCGFFEYGDRMGASPDGLTSDGGILELKVPYALRNGGEFKSLADQPHYYHQAQMEMLATGRKHGYFAQYIAPKGDPLAPDYVPEQIKVERVEFNENWIDEVLPAVNDFYAWLIAELDNPEHLEPLRTIIDSEEAGQLVAEIEMLKARQKADSEREKELLAKLVELADSKNADVHGHKLTLVERSGSVSWQKVAKELMPQDFDLAPFTGKESSYWRLS